MTVEKIKNVLVLGTGIMGPGIALVFAQAGFAVSVWGPDDGEVERGSQNYRQNADDLKRAGVITQGTYSSVLERAVFSSDLRAASQDADFVIEAVRENIEIKQNLYSELETVCKEEAIIASNTSTLIPSAINKKIRKKDRFLVAHFWNPAYLVPLVEVCASRDTSAHAVETTMLLLKRAGKEPILLKKEVLGFIGNRLMHAMNREAISLIQKGIVDPGDVDKVVTMSFGPRFANLGLLEYLDFCGLDNIRSIQKYLYGDLDGAGGSQPFIDNKVSAGELGIKSGHGFFNWTSRDPDGVRFRRDQEFIRRMTAG